MQNNKTFQAAIWVAAGGYLLYIAWHLVNTEGQGSLMLIMAAVLGLAGAVILLLGFLRLRRIARQMEDALSAGSAAADAEPTDSVDTEARFEADGE